MRIKWYGTASLLIEGGNTRVLVDPYLKKLNKKLPPVPLNEAAGADAAFITHAHIDHFGDIGVFLDCGLQKVYVSETGIRNAKKDHVRTDAMIQLNPNQNIQIGEIGVRTFAAEHCVFDVATVLRVLFSPRTWLHFASAVQLLSGALRYRIDRKDVLALEFSHQDKKIMVLGSAGMDSTVSYPMGADLLVFAYQGRADMAHYMQPFLTVFRPKAVMASHFDDAFPPISHTVSTKGFVEAVQEKLPQAKAFVPVEGQWYEV